MTTSPRGPHPEGPHRSRARARWISAAGALVAGGALALAGLVGASLPAAAATYAPSNYIGGSGNWGALTIAGGTVAPNPDGTYGPITVTRHYDSGDAPATIFQATAPDTLGNTFWTSSFTAGPFTFTQTGLSQCAFANDSCQYYVTVAGSQSQFNDLIVADGTEPSVPTGQPPYFDQFKVSTVTFTPPTPTTPTWGSIQVSYTPGSGSTPDQVSFNASSVDTHGQTVTTYRWTVTKTGSTSPSDTHTFDCATAQCQQQLTLELGADYDVKLDLLNSSGTSFANTSFTAAHPGGSAPTTTTTTHGTTSTTGGTGTTSPSTAPPASSGGGGSGGGEVPSVVVFARPAAAPAAAIDPSTVVWLWRPDDYVPESKQPNKSNQANPPTLKGQTAIEVSTSSTDAGDTSNPGPWLAGLGLFGFAAGGGLIRRRRRLRFEP